MAAETTDVVVVGAGVVGASVAFHLARLGAGRVLLLERDAPASGATGRSGALVRTHYTNAPEATMAAAALPWFTEWGDRVGGDSGFTRTGFLQLVTAQDHALLMKNVSMLQELGIETNLVKADDMRALQPGLDVDDDALGAYEPHSGYADPVATTDALAAAARRLGAEVRVRTTVRQLLLDGDRVTGVETTHGRILAGTVVLANGNWSAPLLGSLGVHVPLQAMRGQAAIVTRPASMRGPRGHLAVIDRREGIYLRPHGNDETLVGLSGIGQSERLESPDEVHVSPQFGQTARTRIAQALPEFASSELVRTQVGPLDITPDRCALVGPLPQFEGLVLAVGMSGSGFKKAPALGSCVAELITTGRSSTAPIEAFRPDRFERGHPVLRADYLVAGDDDSREALIH